MKAGGSAIARRARPPLRRERREAAAKASSSARREPARAQEQQDGGGHRQHGDYGTGEKTVGQVTQDRRVAAGRDPESEEGVVVADERSTLAVDRQFPARPGRHRRSHEGGARGVDVEPHALRPVSGDVHLRVAVLLEGRSRRRGLADDALLPEIANSFEVTHLGRVVGRVTELPRNEGSRQNVRVLEELGLFPPVEELPPLGRRVAGRRQDVAHVQEGEERSRWIVHSVVPDRLLDAPERESVEERLEGHRLIAAHVFELVESGDVRNEDVAHGGHSVRLIARDRGQGFHRRIESPVGVRRIEASLVEPALNREEHDRREEERRIRAAPPEREPRAGAEKQRDRLTERPVEKVAGRHLQLRKVGLGMLVEERDQDEARGRRPGEDRSRAAFQQPLHPESGQRRGRERAEEDHPFVQTNVEARQFGESVHDPGKPGSDRDSEHADEEQGPLLPAPRKKADRRERPENGARVAGRLMVALDDEPLAREAVIERHQVRNGAANRARDRHRAFGLRVDLRPEEVLRGVRERSGQRQQKDGGETQCQDPRDEREEEWTQPPALARDGELEEEPDSRAGKAMKEGLRVAGGQDQKERDDREGDRPAARLGDEAPQAQQEQRKGGGRGGQRIAGVEDQVIAERPADSAEEGGKLSALQVAKEEVRAEKGQEEVRRHLEGPRLRQWKKKPEPCRRVKNRGLLDGKERLPCQDEAIPERKSPVSHRLADRLAPRDLLVDDVAERPVLRRLRPEVRREVAERLGLVGDVDRRVDARGEERLPHQEKRPERENDPDPGPNRRNEAVGEEESRRHYAEVHGEQPQDEQKHAGSVYPDLRRPRLVSSDPRCRHRKRVSEIAPPPSNTTPSRIRRWR